MGPGPAGAPAWSATPAPSEVIVRPGAGAGGSDRVTLVWPDRTIRNTWLRVIVKADANTGLARPDVFCFGNLIGETGLGAGDDDTVLTVNAVDSTTVRRNLSPRSPAPPTSPYDFNRDGRVNAVDLAAARSGLKKSLPLVLTTPLAVAEAFVTGGGEAIDPGEVEDARPEACRDVLGGIGRAGVHHNDFVHEVGRRLQAGGQVVLLVAHER